jgi:hypothetical protein
LEKTEGTAEKGVVSGRLWCAYLGNKIYIGLADDLFPPSSGIELEEALEVILQRQPGPQGVQVGVLLVPIFPSNDPIPRLQITPDFVIKSDGDQQLENYYKTATHRSVLIAPPPGRIQFP